MVTLQDVEDETFMSDAFLNLFRILNNEVTEVTAKGGYTVELADQNASDEDAQGQKYWMGAFPNNYLEDKGDFPIGIIRNPYSSDVRRGFRLSEEYYTFDISVYARRSEHTSLIMSKMWNTLKNYEEDLAEVGLYNLSHGQTDNDMVMRGEMKVHSMTMPVTVRRTRCS